MYTYIDIHMQNTHTHIDIYIHMHMQNTHTHIYVNIHLHIHILAHKHT